MSNFYIKDSEFPITLKHRESGQEYTLSGSTELALARMLISMDERLDKIELIINTIKAQINEKNTRSGQEDQRKEA
tara:strand:+ start:3419 stop:3646 length:228 start_codon:yes stop_codon:yes gene_type:complete